ncbi:MAG: hypothetical protein ACE5G0_09620 [Rhodothermales bacterium]
MNHRASHFARCLVGLLIVFFPVMSFPTGAIAAPPDDMPQEDLFDHDDLLELTLAGDLKTIFKDKSDDRPYRPATLWLQHSRDDSVSFDIGVKTRGYYRRLYLDCNVPPLRLNFKKKEVKNTIFAGQNKLKLVTHCKNSEVYEQYTLQEYLVYKSYNLLTDAGFRVRLVRITYMDTQSKRKPVTHYGFLIEDEDRLAERLGGRLLETGVIQQKKTNREQAALLAVFQYMIGNTDWSVPGHHNIKIVFLGPDIPPLSIPYDFDMAGIISTRYAVPDARLGIRSVRERLFRGNCRTEEEFGAVFAQFDEQKEAIYSIYQDFPHLTQKNENRVVKYLDGFYKTISRPKSIKREFLAECRES